MVTDQQIRRLRMLISKEKTQAIAASKAGMDAKTARKYIKSGKLPTELEKEHTWKTRKDPFERIWPEVVNMLQVNPGLEAKTIFEELQRKYPGKWQDGQLRTVQRKVRMWRATEGPAKEIFFPQIHYPGELGAFDFTRMNSLNITINHQPFEHMVAHFVLTYSNWETGKICFSESFESLSEGLQHGFWELGGVPKKLRTDCLTAAVHKECNAEEFTDRYSELLNHYRIKGEKTQPRSANENGDAEQSHNRFKKAVDQALMLRGSRDFEEMEQYEAFLKKIFAQLNSGRKERFKEECKVLRPLPADKLDTCKSFKVKVGGSSTIRVLHNTYSAHSRLKGEWVKARVHVHHIDIWYAQKKVDSFPRIRGENKHRVRYRHIIEWLVRKPGAFENYRYKEDLYPSSYFRMAYDSIKSSHPHRANKEYLKILYLAFKESELKVELALSQLLAAGGKISATSVEKIVAAMNENPVIPDVEVADIEISAYDELLSKHRKGVIVNA